MTIANHLPVAVAIAAIIVLWPALSTAQISTSSARATTSLERGKGPNFVVFYIDDMGYYDIGVNGSTFYETPNIDKLAAEGVRFTNGYAACPVCSPSRVALLTGKYPARLGTTDFFRAGKEPRVKDGQTLVPAVSVNHLEPSEVTIAEALKNHGYKTYVAGKWHLGKEEEYSPQNQGFEVNVGANGSGHPKSYFSPYSNPDLSDGPEGEYLTDRLSSETAKFIKSHSEQPFFVYLPYYNVHTPLQGKPDLVAKYEKKRKALGLDDKLSSEGQVTVRDNQSHPVFAAMVESVDQGVGTVMDALEKAGVADNTVVIFTSDNGGLSTVHTLPTSNKPLRAGKGWMYEGGIKVPLIVKWPGVANAGTVSDAVITGTDFFPTMLAMANLPLLPEHHLDGVSFVDVLKNPDASATTNTTAKAGEPRDIFWHYPHYGNQGGSPSSAIRSGDWKLIKWYEDERVELFNLKDDPYEQSDLAKQNTEITEQLETKLTKWLGEVDAKFPTKR